MQNLVKKYWFDYINLKTRKFQWSVTTLSFLFQNPRIQEAPSLITKVSTVSADTIYIYRVFKMLSHLYLHLNSLDLNTVRKLTAYIVQAPAFILIPQFSVFDTVPPSLWHRVLWTRTRNRTKTSSGRRFFSYSAVILRMICLHTHAASPCAILRFRRFFTGYRRVAQAVLGVLEGSGSFLSQAPCNSCGFGC